MSAGEFEATALCDASPTVLRGVGDGWGVLQRRGMLWAARWEDC
jgi:hypothetical protein